MTTKQLFRNKVLKAHYDLANGRLLTPVMRTAVAERLGIPEYNDPDLMDAIHYLEQKYLLRISTNIENMLTDIWSR